MPDPTSPRPAGRVGVIGSANLDLVTRIERMPAPGETLAARGFATGFGGKGANQAAAAARLGAEVVMVGCVGSDAFGPQIADNLRAQGVDTRHLRRVPDSDSGVAAVFVDSHGENAILITAGANAALGAQDIEAAGADLTSCAVIVLQLEVPLATIRHALAWARARAIPVLLNPAPVHPELVMADLAGLDLLVPNEGELAALTGMPATTEAEIDAAARRLIAVGVGAVVVTLGARGARWITADAVRPVAPVAVEVVDTTGAGDAFIGALAAGMAQGLTMQAALARATRYAAASITRPGAQAAYPSAAEFAAFCAAHP